MINRQKASLSGVKNHAIFVLLMNCWISLFMAIFPEIFLNKSTVKETFDCGILLFLSYWDITVKTKQWVASGLLTDNKSLKCFKGSLFYSDVLQTENVTLWMRRKDIKTHEIKFLSLRKLKLTSLPRAFPGAMRAVNNVGKSRLGLAKVTWGVRQAVPRMLLRVTSLPCRGELLKVSVPWVSYGLAHGSQILPGSILRLAWNPSWICLGYHVWSE